MSLYSYSVRNQGGRGCLFDGGGGACLVCGLRMHAHLGEKHLLEHGHFLKDIWYLHSCIPQVVKHVMIIIIIKIFNSYYNFRLVLM